MMQTRQPSLCAPFKNIYCDQLHSAFGKFFNRGLFVRTCKKCLILLFTRPSKLLYRLNQIRTHNPNEHFAGLITFRKCRPPLAVCRFRNI